MDSNGLASNARGGLATMDHEHALELEIVRELQAALRRGELEAARELVERLEDFTNAHFLAEQLLMRLHAYPGYAAHEGEHDRLIDELRQLRARIDGGAVADPGDEVERLEQWLKAHMASADHALADYLRQPGSGE